MASPVFAEEEASKSIRMGFSVDYAVAAMGQVNTELNKGTGVTNIGPGVAGMINLDAALLPFLMAGVRGGYLYCMPAGASYLLDTVDVTYNASLIPVEAGVTANLEIPGMPLSVMAGIYGGYGFAAASVKKVINLLDAVYTQPYTGGAFIGEALVTANFKMSSSMYLSVNGGYRLANIPRMIQSEDVTYDLLGVSTSAGAKGDILQDSDSNDLAFDFSGFSVGAGLSLGF